MVVIFTYEYCCYGLFFYLLIHVGLLIYTLRLGKYCYWLVVNLLLVESLVVGLVAGLVEGLVVGLVAGLVASLVVGLVVIYVGLLWLLCINKLV
jgi:hypothetical protein